MSQTLTRRQAVALGFLVLVTLAFGGYGIARIADRQGFWTPSTDIAVGFPEAHDITPGTPVRVRGVDAGQVVAIEYPDHDDAGAEVTVRLRVQSRYARRLFADATAQVHSSGVFGSKIIAISPGTPAAGPLETGRLRGVKPFDLDEAMADLRDTAGEVKKLAAEARGFVQDVRQSEGTLGKLIHDDDLYRDLKEIAGDAKSLVKRTDKAVGTVEGEMTNLKGFVADGRDTLRSLKQGTDAVSRMPIIRSYVEDAPALLVRPAHRRDRRVYNVADLFENNSAILTETGKAHLATVTDWLRGIKNDNADVVVAAFHDPADPNQTAASALELTRKQAETVIEFLKDKGIHKLGWVTRRKMTPLGMGTNPSPVVEKDSIAASNVQVLLFTPP